GDPAAGAAGDDVAGRGGGAADGVPRRPGGHRDADPVRQNLSAGGVGADGGARDDIAPERREQNGAAAEAVEVEAAHRAAAGGDLEPVVGEADAAADQLDERLPGLAVEAGLRGAVDGDGIGDRRQCRGQVDGVHAGSGDVEDDPVEAGGGVGV